MTTHTDITRLRALHTASLGDDPEGDAGFAFHNIIHDCAPALFDELERRRSHDYVATTELVTAAIAEERAAVVRYLRQPSSLGVPLGVLADEIERGLHVG